MAYRPCRLRQNRVTTSCEIGSRSVCRHACPTRKPAELRSSSFSLQPHLVSTKYSILSLTIRLGSARQGPCGLLGQPRRHCKGGGAKGTGRSGRKPISLLCAGGRGCPSGIAGGQGSQRARDPSRPAKTRYWRKKMVPLQSAQRKTLWYYRGLARRSCEKLPGQLANELHEIVEVLEAAG